MSTRTGLDVLASAGFEALAGKAIGVVCNQASIDSGGRHAIELLLPLHREGKLRIQAAFGPQHGIWGHTQDNMIEWEGYTDPHTGLTFHSLYGTHREPTDAMLAGIELLVVDLQDVGARYYTFIWTLALCMKACAHRGIPLLVLDRPNPLGGLAVEGPGLLAELRSFVGWHPIPVRHGLTVGEIALWLQATHYPEAIVTVQQMEGWARDMAFEETGLIWGLPSPNMPSPKTAWVYPGMCLMEATLLSEGRGTTRPFEIFGAPHLDARALCEALNAEGLPGAHFQPFWFEPTFNKHALEMCGGAFLHVLDRAAFEPVLTGIAVLRAIHAQSPSAFRWLPPPYEYEYEKQPIDILAGSPWVAQAVEAHTPLREIRDRMADEVEPFRTERKPFLLY